MNNTPPFACLSILVWLLLAGCAKGPAGSWEIELSQGLDGAGVMEVIKRGSRYEIVLNTYNHGVITLDGAVLEDSQLLGTFNLYNKQWVLNGTIRQEVFEGKATCYDDTAGFYGIKQSDKFYTIDRSHVNYLLPESEVSPMELDIDHARIIARLNGESLQNGARIYNSNCINCHGTPEIEGSIPLSTKFWDQPLKAGSDAFSMYQTITRGFGSMPPQVSLTPREKYHVILYIQQEFIRKYNPDQYISSTPGYLAGLPEGSSIGPDIKPYHPWSDMDYGNFFINTYELVDQETGPARYHSPPPVPYPDEDYSRNNFAYKGIAVRLDKGHGGVSKGNTWMIFDHDLMRVAGGWTGKGFIDWEGILLNDRHETYPRTIGKLHFETPVGPGWAHPSSGSFKDPRFRARDGRAFGPLPKNWAEFKGIYRHGQEAIISYKVGSAKILEKLSMENLDGQPIFTRTLNISPSSSILKMRVAPITNTVELAGDGGMLTTEDGFVMLQVNKSTAARLKLFVAAAGVDGLEELAMNSGIPESLDPLTKGGPPQYSKTMRTPITRGSETGVLSVDRLTPPFENPWNCRMKLSGLDFLSDPNQAVACATDGDVWLISGLLEDKDSLTWRRIAAGLFQPLGIKVLDDNIFVTCRDQVVLLKDLNGDMEIDFYQCFNSDHQVTDHFHEFAMGLQADQQGNLYYAKSARHAREALIPQHGTLIKLSKDGTRSEIIADGFRAANGVCINPDGSFIVTDQQGNWNPMNRINWIQGKGGFYGNMWAYDPPDDTSRTAMEQPMIWVDMEFDRSPSELVWVESQQWEPLNGNLLSFSYGFGKMQLVLHETVDGVRQGGVIDIPGVKFLTGVMRGRFNQADGQLYACGMSAWGTTQLMRGGGLYRVKYNDQPMPLATGLEAWHWGLHISFAEMLDATEAIITENFKIQSWDLVRSSRYGSDRHNKKELEISDIELSADGKSVKLFIENLQPVDVMTISYDISDRNGNPMEGTIQNTIHKLRMDPSL